MSEFDGIGDYEGWADKLRELLSDAATAAKLDDQAARLALSERLTKFVETSYPNDAPMKALDAIAAKAAIGLLEQNIAERLKSIVARNVELAQLGKQFGQAADGAKATAAAIRLERIGSALTSLNDGILKMKELRDSLKSAVADKDLAKALDKAMEAARTARDLLERK